MIKDPQEEEGAVFPGETKTAIVLGQTSVRRRYERFVKLAGGKTIRLHEFRRFCVSDS